MHVPRDRDGAWLFDAIRIRGAAPAGDRSGYLDDSCGVGALHPHGLRPSATGHIPGNGGPCAHRRDAMPDLASSADHVSDDRRLPIPRQREADLGACNDVRLDITDGPRWDAGREAPARWRPYRADIDVLIDGDHGSKQPHHSVASGRECYPAGAVPR